MALETTYKNLIYQAYAQFWCPIQMDYIPCGILPLTQPT